MPRGKAAKAAVDVAAYDSLPKRQRKSNNPDGRLPDPTVSDMKARVDEYFAECEVSGRFPTESGMFLHLGMIGKKQDDYLRKAKYAEVWEWAKLRRIDWLENQMVTNPRSAQGCMNALKQEKNGGYIDRSSANAGSKNKELKINLAGVGGKEAAG